MNDQFHDIRPTTAPGSQEESRVANFIKYNNTVPIVLGILFLGTTGALAASPEVRADVFSSSRQVVHVDNTRIVSADIDSYPLSVQINNVREDDENYYVSYTLTTIDLADGIWQDLALSKEMSVSKAALRDRDLGTYVSEQLAQVREAERVRLKETQGFELKKGASAKVVATTYSGLVGKFLSPTEKEFPGYVPVVESEGSGIPEGGDPNRLASPITSPTFDANAPDASSQQPTSVTVPSSSSGADTTPPQISVLGDNPARVAVGQSYTDFGVAVVDDRSSVTTLEKYLDGARVSTISINTSSVGSHTIVYKATDQAGNSAQTSRTVTVYQPVVGGSTPTGTTSTGSTDTSTPTPDTSGSTDTTTTTPAPTTAPEPAPAPADTTTTTTTAPSDTGTAPSTDTSGSTNTTTTTTPAPAPEPTPAPAS